MSDLQLETKVRLLVKVTKHSFQVPMPNSPLFFIYAWAPIFCKSRSQSQKGYSHISAKVYAVAMAMGLFKKQDFR